MKEKSVLFWKKIPLKRILLFLFLLYLAALIVPYIPHKKVSDSFRKSFSENTFYSNSTGTERAAYIDDNEEALAYRLRMIEEAQEEIILSTFDFNADHGGKDILAALQNAADRGVSVRVIVDGISGFLDLRGNPWFQAAASHENIEIRIYNPVNLLMPWNIQARLHDKYLIIDRELFIYETQDDPDSSLYQLLDYFEQVWQLEESKDYICSNLTDKVNDCILELEKQYDKLTEQYPEMLEEWDWDQNEDDPQFVSSMSKKQYHWICAKNHRFAASPAERMRRNKSCPVCKSLLVKRPDIALEWHPTKNNFGPESVTSSSHKEAWFICGNCGNEYICEIVDRVRRKGPNCIHCR